MGNNIIYNKKHKYSLRKFKLGLVSVAVGTLFLISGGVALASEGNLDNNSNNGNNLSANNTMDFSSNDVKPIENEPEVVNNNESNLKSDLSAIIKPITPVIIGQEVNQSAVVLPNLDDVKIKQSDLINGLKIDATGSLVGTPTTIFDGEEESKTISIPVTLEKEGNSQTITVPIIVLRDTDNDGMPDVDDTDDDGDGILDNQDNNPKISNNLSVVINTTKYTILGEETNQDNIVVSNKDDVIIMSKEVDGLSINDKGSLVGRSNTIFEENLEEKEVSIPISVTREENGIAENVNGNVLVKVLKDTDKDGIPDITDEDDDNDGILDKDDNRLKIVDKLAIIKNSIKPVIFGQETNQKGIIVSNKPEAKIVSETVDGLSIDETGALVGVPTTIFDDNIERKEVILSVTVTKEVNGVLESIEDSLSIIVLRDTDMDGEVDIIDSDDENDGIPDVEDYRPKIADELSVLINPSIPTVIFGAAATVENNVVIPNKPGSTITSEEVDGLRIDEKGNLVGIATTILEGNEEKKIITIPVEVSKLVNGNKENVTTSVSVKILRDTDGDGKPDIIDEDDDNDGITDDKDNDPKTQDQLYAEIDDTEGVVVGEATKQFNIVVPNKKDAKIKSEETDGLRIDENGHLVGTPTVVFEDSEKIKEVYIPVEVSHKEEELILDVFVRVLKDETLKYSREDSDNDGVLDIVDYKPNNFDNLRVEFKPITPVKPYLRIDKQKIVVSNKWDAIISSNSVDGLSIDAYGFLVGTPTTTFEGNVEEKEVVITVTIERNEEHIEKDLKVKVLRDTDGDGKPDFIDEDDDNDGIIDTEDHNIKVRDSLAIIKNLLNPVISDQETNQKNAITLNKKEPVDIESIGGHGLIIDGDGNLVGKSYIDFSENEEYILDDINIIAIGYIEQPGETVSIKVLRDTDGDGISDIVSTDDDGDGIPDIIDKNPKVKDDLIATLNPVKSVIYGQVISQDNIVISNKSDSKITSKEVDGLRIDENGNLVGTPTTIFEGNLEEKEISIPIVVTKEVNGKKERVEKMISIRVLRDTDNDGKPDIIDEDDDNDNILDKQDRRSKITDELSSILNIIKPVTAGQETNKLVISSINKPATTITSKEVDGLRIDENGNLTGKATTEFTGDVERKEIEILVTLENNGETKKVVVPITVFRDTDKDGKSDIIDEDDDNDAIPDKQDKRKKIVDYLSVDLNLIKPVTINKKTNQKYIVIPNKPGSIIESKETNGLRIDENGSLVGTPTIDFKENEQYRIVNILVVITKEVNGNIERVETNVAVKVLRDKKEIKIPEKNDVIEKENDVIEKENEVVLIPKDYPTIEEKPIFDISSLCSLDKEDKENEIIPLNTKLEVIKTSEDKKLPNTGNTTTNSTLAGLGLLGLVAVVTRRRKNNK